MRVIVMAQGRQERLAHLGFSKQLLLLDSGPIVERTFALVREYLGPDVPVTVVAPVTAKWTEITTRYNVELRTHKSSGRSILDGLRQVADLLTDEQNIILLGDVVFSRRVLKIALACPGPLHVIGRTGLNKYTNKNHELFALVVGKDVKDKLIEAVTDAKWRAKIALVPNNPGRLWDLKERLDIPIVPTDDWTEDIDTLDDVMNVLPRLRQLAREDVRAGT